MTKICVLFSTLFYFHSSNKEANSSVCLPIISEVVALKRVNLYLFCFKMLRKFLENLRNRRNIYGSSYQADFTNINNQSPEGVRVTPDRQVLVTGRAEHSFTNCWPRRLINLLGSFSQGCLVTSPREPFLNMVKKRKSHCSTWLY